MKILTMVTADVRDRAALDAMRAAPEPPAASTLFRRFPAEPAMVTMSVLADSQGDRVVS